MVPSAWCGHSATILETSAPDGRVIGIDLDLEALAVAEGRLHAFGERCSLINGNFAEMDVLLEKHSVRAVDGILLDLGVVVSTTGYTASRV